MEEMGVLGMSMEKVGVLRFDILEVLGVREGWFEGFKGIFGFFLFWLMIDLV